MRCGRVHRHAASGCEPAWYAVEVYKRTNLVRVEVTSRHVAELAPAMCGVLFECTTGAQLPIDGGNERVI